LVPRGPVSSRAGVRELFARYSVGVVQIRRFFGRPIQVRLRVRRSQSPQYGLEVPVALERFRFSCSNAVAAMPDVVRALVGHEESEGCRHQLADAVERARTRGA